MALATYFADLRKKSDISQPKLARKLSERLGHKVSVSTVYRWEKGITKPSGPYLAALLDILKGSAAEVSRLLSMNGDEDVSPEIWAQIHKLEQTEAGRKAIIDAAQRQVC